MSVRIIDADDDVRGIDLHALFANLSQIHAGVRLNETSGSVAAAETTANAAASPDDVTAATQLTNTAVAVVVVRVI